MIRFSMQLLSLLASVLLLVSCANTPTLAPNQRLDRAEQLLQGWKTRWAPSGKPAEGQDATDAAAARREISKLKPEESSDPERWNFLIAQAQFACGDLSGAFAKYRLLLENFPLTRHREDTEKAIYQIATQWSLRGGSFLGTGWFSDRDDALKALTYLVDYAPRSPFADDALRLSGIIQFQDRDFEDAISTFERILQGYPESIWCDFAEYHIALSYLRRVRRPTTDRDGLLEAETRFRDYLARRSEGAFRAQAETGRAEALERLAESSFEIGNYYRRIGEPLGARYHWEETVKKYPNSRFAELARKAIEELGAKTPGAKP